MNKLIITAACDSRVSYPANHYCLPSTRENVPKIADEYVRCLNAGASIAHLHGVRRLEDKIQADGKKLSRLDIDGWNEMTTGIRDKADCIIQYGIAGARLEDRIPLMKLGPDMMSVAFNAHDEYFQPDPQFPPNAIYALHPLEELARLLSRHGRVRREDGGGVVPYAAPCGTCASCSRKDCCPGRSGRRCSSAGRAARGRRPRSARCSTWWTACRPG